MQKAILLSVGTLLGLLISGVAISQGPIVDSLRKAVYLQPVTTVRLASLVQLCEQRASLHPDSLMRYAVMTTELARKLQVDSVLRTSYLYKCYALMGQGRRDSAIVVADSMIASLKQMHPNHQLLPRLMIVRSRLFIRQNKHREALDIALRAMALTDNLALPSLQMQSRNAVGLAHMEVGNNRQAVEWFLKGIQQSSPRDTLPFYEVLCSNLSSCYNNLGKFDSALYFAGLSKSLNIKRENLTNMANILNIEADVFLNLKQTNKAEANLNEALDIRQRLGDLNFLLSDMAQLALLYAKNGKTQQGIALAQQAISIANANKIVNKKIFIYQSLAENYKAAGQFEALSKVQAQLIAIKDSLFEQSSAEAIASLQTQYDLEKSQNTILTQKIDLQNSRLVVYALAALMLMAGITSYFVSTNNKRRQRIKLELAIDDEKRAAAAAVKQAEENERIRIAADLHDNLGVYAASLASNLMYISADPANPTATNAMLELRTNSKAIVDQLNDTIWVLHKEALSITAIADRLKLFMRNIGRSYPHIQFDCLERVENDQLLPASQAFHLYRLLQEAINNALKHSQCTTIEVSLMAKDQQWMVSVADNGIGMDQAVSTKAGGYGIAGMMQRCAEAGWQVSWQTSQDGGTTVSIFPNTN